MVRDVDSGERLVAISSFLSSKSGDKVLFSSTRYLVVSSVFTLRHSYQYQTEVVVPRYG